jgi:16S rRNA (cytosine967-C5)-methyltransferase
VADLQVDGKLLDIPLEGFLSAVNAVPSPLTAISDPVLRLAIGYSMPEFAVRHWIKRIGESECGRLCAALNTSAPISIRVNLIRCSVDHCRSALAGEGVGAESGRIAPEALILQKRVSIQALQSFRDGLFEMQDEGSQLIAHLVAPVPGEVIADACAGGGGKSLHMAALMKNEGVIFASDLSSQRLRQAVQRAGRSGVTILKTCETDMGQLAGKCDRVLVDAPCSGSGTFRRNPWMKALVSPQQVAEYSAMQHEILKAKAGLVRTGGRLVYATCSLFAEENEETVERFLDTNRDFRLLNAGEVLAARGIHLDGRSDFLTVAPHREGTDGFFAAAMERTG